MIYGTPRDKNMNRLIRFLNRYPVFPLFGDGTSLMQPSLWRTWLRELYRPSTTRGRSCSSTTWPLIFPPYRQVVDTILRRLGRRVVKVPINMRVAYEAVRLLQWVPRFPISESNFWRLQEDKVFDISSGQKRTAIRASVVSKRALIWEIAALRQAGCFLR